MPEIRIRVTTDLRRALDTIAHRESMTVRDLLTVAARELVAAYHDLDATRCDPSKGDNVTIASPTPPRVVASTLETVWTPHRNAAPLVDRPSRCG